MSAEPPPSDSNGGYNPDDWTNANDPIDNQYLAQNYLQFPLAQGSETLADTIISGTLTAQDTSTFSDLATFNNGIDIASTAGIKFSDNSVQTVAFVEANYAQLNSDNTFLPTFTQTFSGSVDLGTSAIAKTQTSGDSSTFVATTAFVQDAVQVSGVQVGDSPLLWSGANTNQYNAGTVATLAYTYPYGLSQLYNISGGTEEFSLVANNGQAGLQNNAFRIYCTQGNKTGTEIASLTPQLILSNNGTSMQVKDGINIPLGQTYSINNVNILNPYSTTVQMNSAISSATSSLAPINSPTFTGVPLLTTTPTVGITNPQAVANLQYITNQGFATTTYVDNAVAPLASTTYVNNAVAPLATTSYVNSTFAPVVSPALSGIPITPTWTTGNDILQIANVQYVNNAISAIPAGAIIQSGQINNCVVSGDMSSGKAGYVQNDYIMTNTFTVSLSALGLQTYTSNTAFVVSLQLSNLQYQINSGFLQMFYGITTSVNTTSGSDFTIITKTTVHVNNPANNVDGMPTFNLVWTTSPRLATSYA